MWGVPVDILCRKHLMGEHVEMHMFVGTINKGISIQGYLDKGLVNPALIKERHDALAAEMLRRGYRHNSPLPSYDCGIFHKLDIKANALDLFRRCPECLARYERRIK